MAIICLSIFFIDSMSSEETHQKKKKPKQDLNVNAKVK